MADQSSWKSAAFGALAAVILTGFLGNAAHGQSTAYTYDGLGRLSSVSYSDGKTIAYTYDAAGNRTQSAVSGEDLTPNAFDLGPAVSNATSGTLYTSTAPTLSGFNSPLAISVAGGEYRIDGGAWQATTSMVRPGQTVQVRALAPSTPSSTQTATLSVGSVSDTFQVTTSAASDTTPDPFDLGGPVTGAAGGSWVASNAPSISGINLPAPVSVSGGQYRISGGAWQTTAGSVSVGQTVQVQALAPTVGGTSQTATLTVGGVSDTFQVTTVVDTTPDPFELGGPVTGAAAGAWTASSSPTITGINTATSISVAGGQYRINGGAWQTAAGSVSAGQTVQVQAQAPTTGGASQTATLTVGGASDSFTVTTITPPDYTPDPLNWGDVSISFRGRPSGQLTPPKFVDTATLTISGLGSGLSITLSFAQDTISPGGAGLFTVVYKNGIALSPLSLSIADGANVNRGVAGLTVSVTNGDTIRFRTEVFDSTIVRNSGNASGRSARHLVYNQTTNMLFDTFNIYGSYAEPTYCGQEEC